MTIGKRIQNARLKKGYSQTTLAKLLGYKSRSSINKIEKDERDIPRSSIKKFAEILNVTPSYLMGWDELEKQLSEDLREMTKFEVMQLFLKKKIGFLLDYTPTSDFSEENVDENGNVVGISKVPDEYKLSITPNDNDKNGIILSDEQKEELEAEIIESVKNVIEKYFYKKLFENSKET